jgi:hypothetical protein
MTILSETAARIMVRFHPFVASSFPDVTPGPKIDFTLSKSRAADMKQFVQCVLRRVTDKG